MKTYKLGDRVKTVQLGECTIIGIDIDTDTSTPYMYDVIGDLDPEETESYTSDWEYSVNDEYSSLIEDEKKLPSSFINKWMLVSDDKLDWKKRFVIKKFVGHDGYNGVLVFCEAENIEELELVSDTSIYEYVKELEEIEPEEQISSHKQQIDKMFKNL